MTRLIPLIGLMLLLAGCGYGTPDYADYPRGYSGINYVPAAGNPFNYPHTERGYTPD